MKKLFILLIAVSMIACASAQETEPVDEFTIVDFSEYNFKLDLTTRLFPNNLWLNPLFFTPLDIEFDPPFTLRQPYPFLEFQPLPPIRTYIPPLNLIDGETVDFGFLAPRYDPYFGWQYGMGFTFYFD
jgi:hypothetical protein